MSRNIPLYDALFEMEVSICQTFPALDPVRMRREKCGEVLLLLRRMIRYNNTQGGDDAPVDDDVIIIAKKNGDTVTMRRAKDDRSW